MTFKKVFGLLLILIILAAGGIYLLMIEKADDDRMRSLYTEVEPLEREREALIEEKKPGHRIRHKEEIDFILNVTQSPDYKLPTTACIMQDVLGLSKGTGAFDINLGCSGYVYGLAVSKALIQSGIARNVLLITAETYSKHVHPMDRSTRTIFGDGAAATLIGNGGMEIGCFDLGTDGNGKELLMIPVGGEKLPCSIETAKEMESDGNIRSQDNIYMNGTGII